MITSFDHQKTFITKSIYFSALYVNLIRLTLINLLNISSQAKTLEYTNFFGNFVYKNDWIVQNGSGVTNICGTTQIFGGCNSFYRSTTIIKNIQLPCHQTLSLNFQFWHLDNWGNDRLEVIVDNRLVFSGLYYSESTKPSICCHSGSAYGDDVNSVNINFDHFNQFATIKIIGYENYWGISDFQIWVDYVEGCVHGCNNCIRGNCVECQEEWEYDILQQTCFPLCGDQIITDNEECDDGNQQEHDGCFQCKFSCPLFCKQCKFGQCLQCQSNYMLIDQTCYEAKEIQNQKSQDNFSIQISNLFDDGNQYQNLLNDQFANPLPISNFDCNFQTHDIFGYHYLQCETKLIQNCLLSRIDICLECENFYKLSRNKKLCIPKCEDGITVQYEFCDDQNNIQFDGCYKCQTSCQLECKECIEQLCYMCIDGWQIIDYKCYQICGDGLLALSSKEQCDDGNYTPNDGCYDCKFICDQNCSQCSTSNLCFLCLQNFEMDENNLCKPICGDGIIVEGLEECEDFNDIPYDGCYQCMFQCEPICSKCIQGICQECDEGYDLLTEGCNKIIIYKEIDDLEQSDNTISCGNGKLQNSEQCDDGNLENYDGCSSGCDIEENWICNLEQPSSCYLETKCYLTYLNQTEGHQFILMEFSNQVKQSSKSNFTESILSQIINLSQDQYLITINPIVDVDETEFAMGQYEFDILFLNTISIQPNLTISINSLLIDSNNMTVNISAKSIILEKPKFLNQDQINVANKFQALGNALMIGLGALSLLMLFSGNPSQGLEIFDTLQFQSYLKFINVAYPQNLQIYLRSSDIVSINPILITFKIRDVFQTIIEDNFIKSIGKLQEYQINADLLINIQSQISQMGLIVLLYIFLYFYRRFFYNYCFTSKFIYFISSSKSKILEIIGIKLYKFNKKFINLRNLYTMKGLRQICYANAWDLLFKVILFVTSNNQSGYRSIISYFISFGILSMFTLFLCLHFKGLYKSLDISELRNEQHDGVCLLKKLLFILILINLQENDTFQCSTITILIFSYIGFLFMIQENISKIELIGLIWMEAPVMLFTFTSLMYCSDFSNYLTTDFQIFLGFGQIGVLILGLLGPLIKLGIKFHRDLKEYFRDKQPIAMIKLQINKILGFEQIK
ncbi:unnamed protein product [Paramecium octaurelia]|uniref:Uncharacterized protein n=1 Tax=Paramecium octaurelia TaxID=43137 RepID=A0A8S1XRX8_PAROT|nr:unnamed protein product [Paramecium octaurelia]